MTLRKDAIEALIAAIEPLDGLIAYLYSSHGAHCVIGSLGVQSAKCLDRDDPSWTRAASLGLAEWDENEQAWMLNETGYHLAGVNDAGGSVNIPETVTERKTRMLAWLRSQL